MADRLGVEITFSSKRYLELMPAGVDKGAGLTHLADMLGIPMSEVIAVGDSANDLSMIKAAGLGVGVTNDSSSPNAHMTPCLSFCNPRLTYGEAVCSSVCDLGLKELAIVNSTKAQAN